jgi:hypothetical protein
MVSLPTAMTSSRRRLSEPQRRLPTTARIRARMAVLPSWIAAQLRSSGSNFGANRYNDLDLTEVCRRKAFDLL